MATGEGDSAGRVNVDATLRAIIDRIVTGFSPCWGGFFISSVGGAGGSGGVGVAGGRDDDGAVAHLEAGRVLLLDQRAQQRAGVVARLVALLLREHLRPSRQDREPGLDVLVGEESLCDRPGIGDGMPWVSISQATKIPHHSTPWS